MAVEWDESRKSYVEVVKIANPEALGGGSGGGTTSWDDITNKPSEFTPTEHNHDDLYYPKSEVYDKAQIDTNISNLANSLYKVRTSETDEPSYLSSKVDNVTLVIEGSELKVKSIDGLTIGITDISNWLSGTSANIQSQINGINDSLLSLAAGMSFKGKFETYADLVGITNVDNGDLAVVLADENRTGGRSMYVYSGSLGMWEFIGEFVFSDEFIKLKDTPSDYTGHNGKVVKVDETNKKLVFSDVDYNDLTNKPSSTITQLDDAVNRMHGHPNKALLDTYTQTNADLANSVDNTHSHGNKAVLDKLAINSNGELVIDGVVFAPKKDFMFLGLTANKTIAANGFLVFDKQYAGNMPYKTTSFTLQANKTYYVVANPLFTDVSATTFSMQLWDVTNNQVASEYPDSKFFYPSTSPSTAYGNNTFDFIISPTSTKDFQIRVASITSDTSITQYRGNSTLIIFEI